MQYTSYDMCVTAAKTTVLVNVIKKYIYIDGVNINHTIILIILHYLTMSKRLQLFSLISWMPPIRMIKKEPDYAKLEMNGKLLNPVCLAICVLSLKTAKHTQSQSLFLPFFFYCMYKNI